MRKLCKKVSNKYLFIIVGYMESVAMTLVLFFVFINAYIHDYKTLVTINDYGEAHVELIALSLVFIVSLIGLFFVLRDMEDA